MIYDFCLPCRYNLFNVYFFDTRFFKIGHIHTLDIFLAVMSCAYKGKEQGTIRFERDIVMIRKFITRVTRLDKIRFYYCFVLSGIT